MSSLHPPGLYLVATPIGNLGDITLRALELLKLADLIACEDTRQTAKLLSHYGIDAPTLSYNDHNGAERRPHILDQLKQGKRVALVSDAGMPLISDPGYKLVQQAYAESIHVTVLSGASSVLAGLCLSGLPSDRFFFAGFLPPREEAARKDIAGLAVIPSTLILFESARRLGQTLSLLQEGLGDRSAAVVREITKLYEESRRAPLSELAMHYQKNEARGEVVIVVDQPAAENVAAENLEAQLKILLASHSVKEAAAVLTEQTGQKRKTIYALALKLIEERDG